MCIRDRRRRVPTRTPPRQPDPVTEAASEKPSRAPLRPALLTTPHYISVVVPHRVVVDGLRDRLHEVGTRLGFVSLDHLGASAVHDLVSLLGVALQLLAPVLRQ